MTISTGSYVGTGRPVKITLGWRPMWTIVKPDAATRAAQKQPGNWVGRLNYFSDQDSAIDGIVETDDGMWVGIANSVVGVTYYWAALAPSASLSMTSMSWMGNAIGQTVPLPDAVTPVASFIKRDSTLPMIYQPAGGSAIDLFQSTTIASAVTAVAAGAVTLGTATHVNQLDGANGMGEGIDGVFFGASAALAQVTWTGDGLASRIIALPFTPRFGIYHPIDGIRGGRIVTDVMPAGKIGPTNNTALITESSITTNGLQIGAVGGNTSGVVYRGLFIADHADTPSSWLPASPSLTGRKTVWLNGRGTESGVRCGTSDTLNIAGPHSIEFFGAIDWRDLARGVLSALICRGGGVGKSVGDTAGTYSWGLTVNSPTEFSHNWAGPVIGAICADRYMATVDIRKFWRTGCLVGRKPVHYLVTHNGTGGWRMYENGRLIKSRNIDMTTTDLALPNGLSMSGAPTTIGAVDSNGSLTGTLRGRIAKIRVYNAALTPAQVLARYQRECLGSAVADVTAGLVEEWDAANASGTSMPATFNSANNGTIFGGAVLQAGAA